jgi:hypothetical protein
MPKLPCRVFIGMKYNSGNLYVSLLPLLCFFLLLIPFTDNRAPQQKNVYVASVENKIKIGRLTANKNLAFGCKNIFQEILQDKDFAIVESPENADYVLNVEILFFDVNRTKRNISVFHSDIEETLVTMRGTLSDKDGKKIKEAVAEESSTEISTSTLITDEGSGKINQQALSSATKKTCETLINKLLTTKK